MPKRSSSANPDIQIFGKNTEAVDGKVEIKAWTLGGDEVDAQDPAALVKSSFDPATRRKRFWIKVARKGMEAGHIYNPQSPSTMLSADYPLDKELVRLQAEYRPATKDAFDLYLKFLSNRNPVDYRNAERLMNK